MLAWEVIAPKPPQPKKLPQPKPMGKMPEHPDAMARRKPKPKPKPFNIPKADNLS
jgi:hypothetical protein